MSGWETKQLGELVEFLDNKRIPVKESDRLARAGPYPYYGANGQVGWIDDYIFDEPLVLLAEDGGNFGSKEKSIAYKIDRKTWVNNHAHVLRPRNGCDLDYLQRALAFYDVSQYVSGTTRLKLTKSDASRMPITLPPLPIQKQIAAILEKADAARDKRRKANQLTEQFIQAAFLETFGDPVTNPMGWDRLPTEEICSKVADGTHFSPPPQEKGVPYITAKHVKRYGLDFDIAPTYVSEGHHRDIYKRCDPIPGDVIYIKDGVTTGIAAVNRYDFQFSMLSSLALLRPKHEILKAEYLSAYLNIPSVKSVILRQMSGGAIKRLTVAKIKKLNVVMPPFASQEKFSLMVRKIESLRAKQKESQKELENLFNSLMQRAFRGELFT